MQKTYAKFWQSSAVYPSTITEACGTDSEYQLDGRLTVENMTLRAAEVCTQRGYRAFSIRVTDGHRINTLVYPKGVY